MGGGWWVGGWVGGGGGGGERGWRSRFVRCYFQFHALGCGVPENCSCCRGGRVLFCGAEWNICVNAHKCSIRPTCRSLSDQR